MNLNVNTLAIALCITNLMQVGIMFSQFRKSKTNEGPGWWTVGGLCAALAFAFYEFRNLPAPLGMLAIIANNSLLFIALTLVYIGVKRFQNQRENGKALTAFCAVFVLLNIYFTSPSFYNYGARRTILLAGVAVISLLIGSNLTKYKGKLTAFWRYFLSIGFLAFGIASVIGVVLTLTVKKLGGTNENAMMQTGMYVGTIIATTVWTFGFITLINQRLFAAGQEAKERFESIFNTSPDGVFISSITEGIIWNINEGFTALTGYTREETIGKTSLEIDLYENVADRQRLYNELVKKGICENFEANIKKKDGSKITVLISSKKISLNGIPHDSCVMRDITERKLAENKLKKSREQYHLLFENAVETVFVAQNAKIKLCNPIAETLTGYPRDELLSLPISTIIYPDDLQFVLASHVSRPEDGNAVNQYDFRILSKDNKVKWVEIKSIMIEWDNKPATLNFLTDISERKQAVQDLMESEAKYRLITEFASDVIWVLNINKNEYTYMSPSVIHLRGFTPEEVKTMGVEKSFTPESLQIVRYSVTNNLEYFKKTPKASNHYTNELQQTCKNGDVIWVEESTKYRYNVDGEIEIIGVTRNIEDRKKTEAEILYLSYHDQLTGLKNRRYFDNSIRMFEENERIPLTLIMADVNGLKLTNDAFGHKAGDLILEKVANILTDSCGNNGIAARIGGDEFILLLPETDAKCAEKIIEKIDTAITREKCETIILSLSIGFAVKTNAVENIDEIFKKAEDDMYRHKLAESSSMRNQTINLIMKTLYEKNNREMLHSKRVSERCELIAKNLDLDNNSVNQLRLAGLMHDIGKIGIAETILNNPVRLAKDEWAEIRRHSEIGYRILSSVNEFSEIADCILEHHERWDGEGYPRGLSGNNISLQARVISIADSFDAMTSDRPYRKALSEEDAVAEIGKCSGTQFDPVIAKVFVEKVLGKKWA